MTTNSFYRIAENKHSVGDIMKGRGKRPLADTEPFVEELLHRRKPLDCPDRGDSVYMREERDFRTVGVPYDRGYVHTIIPIGKVDRRDLTWIGVLQMRYHKREQLRARARYPRVSDDQVVDGYWSGQASDTPDWEWVAKEAQVVAVDENRLPVRPSLPII